MYDTVAALWRHPPEGVDGLIPWRDYRERRTAEGTRVSRQAGEHGQVQVIRHPDGVLKVERSLPKALTGQNAVDLCQTDVPEALAAVDAELRALAPGVPWPAAGSLDPCKVDYCRSVVMDDPGCVDLTLRRLARLRLPKKSYPVVGESGSVSWPRGAFRPKAYNKGRETGELRYLNVLRLEVGAFGSERLGRIPGLVPVGSGGRLTLVDVLVPQAAEFALGWFLSRVGGIDMTSEDMSDLALLKAMVVYFGPRRAFGLLGLFVGWESLGVRSWEELEALELGDQRSWYRARADLRRFRDDVLKRGQDGGADLDGFQARVASLKRLAA
jgi:hypothetical protein